MAITGVNQTYNFEAAAFADLPTAPPPGQWAHVTGTGKSYYSTNGTWVDMTPGAATIADGDKGDITTSGSGATWTIDNDAVTYAKIQDVSATDRLLGRDTTGSGNIEELTVGGGVEFTGSGGIQTSALTGDVTKTAGGTATTIANDAVTYAKMQNVSATDKVLGRSTAGSGDVEEIACTAAGRAMIGAASATAQAALLGSSFAPYKYSFDNPPASPSTYNDEFNSTTLDAKWAVSSGYTGADPGVNTPVAGTVGVLSSLTTPIYDLTTWPGWMLFQSEETTGGSVPYSYARYAQTITLGTDATFFIKICTDNRQYATDQEGIFALMLTNSGDSNEQIAVKIDQTGTVRRVMFWVLNNGSLSTTLFGQVNEAYGSIPYYIMLWKSGNDYYAGLSHGSVTPSVLGPFTKTGVTTFDTVELRINNANDTPSIISGIDFFRYYPSITYALIN